MTAPSHIPPFHVSDIFTNLYHAPDLLDLSDSGKLDICSYSSSCSHTGPSSPTLGTTSSPQPAATSIFSSATSIAAAAGRRAAAVASAAAPAAAQSAGLRGTASPDRTQAERRIAGNDQKIEVRCVEGYGDNLYVGRSDGVVEWWYCDPAAGASKVSSQS